MDIAALVEELRSLSEQLPHDSSLLDEADNAVGLGTTFLATSNPVWNDSGLVQPFTDLVQQQLRPVLGQLRPFLKVASNSPDTNKAVSLAVEQSLKLLRHEMHLLLNTLIQVSEESVIIQLKKTIELISKSSNQQMSADFSVENQKNVENEIHNVEETEHQLPPLMPPAIPPRPASQRNSIDHIENDRPVYHQSPEQVPASLEAAPTEERRRSEAGTEQTEGEEGQKKKKTGLRSLFGFPKAGKKKSSANAGNAQETVERQSMEEMRSSTEHMEPPSEQSNAPNGFEPKDSELAALDAHRDSSTRPSRASQMSQAEKAISAQQAALPASSPAPVLLPAIPTSTGERKPPPIPVKRMASVPEPASTPNRLNENLRNDSAPQFEITKMTPADPDMSPKRQSFDHFNENVTDDTEQPSQSEEIKPRKPIPGMQAHGAMAALAAAVMGRPGPPPKPRKPIAPGRTDSDVSYDGPSETREDTTVAASPDVAPRPRPPVPVRNPSIPIEELNGSTHADSDEQRLAAEPRPLLSAQPLNIKKKDNSISGDDKALQEQSLGWLNQHLKAKDIQVTDLFSCLTDGLNLIYALEAATGESVGKYSKKPILPVHRIDNISVALKFLERKGINTHFMNPQDVLNEDRGKVLTLFSYILKTFP